MKDFTRFLSIMSIVMALCHCAWAQTPLGSSKGFMDKLKTANATHNTSARSDEKTLLLKSPAQKASTQK
jgi:hypothetical protein